jgi:hypothetical protein
MLLRYLYTISNICSTISNFVFFDFGVSLSGPAWAAAAPTRYWTQIAVCTLHCESIIARGSRTARAALSRRGPPQRRLHSAALPHRQQHRPQPPERARTSRVHLLVRAERRSNQQRTSSGTWILSHCGRRGGRCEPQPWSEQWKQPEFAWRRRLSYA